MKKTILAAVAAIAAGQVFADRTPLEIYSAAMATNNEGRVELAKTLTTAEWRAYFDSVISAAATNKVAGNRLSAFPLSCTAAMGYRDNAKSLAEEYDEKFSKAGIGAAVPWVCVNLPKMREAWIADPTNAVKVSKLRKTIEMCRKDTKFKFWEAPIEERANLFMEYHVWASTSVKYSTLVQSISVGLKRKMREKGMSIVVKDGVNPVQAEIDVLSNAFNAPRFAGVKEWFAKWYPEYQWIDSEQDTVEEVNAFKDKVYYGEVPFSTYAQNYLRFYLGVTEYNKFVQDFNK